MLNKILRLERPLAVLDFETTGLNPDRDRVIQIALTIHYVNKDPIAWVSLINPGIPILNSGHRITDADVANAPKFKDIAATLAPRILDVDIAGHNVEFDIRFMRFEMALAGVSWPWKGHTLDTLKLYRKYHPHTLSNYYKEYSGENLTDAHDAGADVKAVEVALAGQLNRHQDIPRTVKELIEHCMIKNANAVDKDGKFTWQGDEAVFGFGKFRGKSLKDPSVRGYLSWMVNVGEFTDEVKEIAQGCLDGEFPVKP